MLEFIFGTAIDAAICVVAFRVVAIFSLAMVGTCYIINRAFYYANSIQ